MSPTGETFSDGNLKQLNHSCPLHCFVDTDSFGELLRFPQASLYEQRTNPLWADGPFPWVQARLIASATSLPVIGDGDTGYGNAMNVKRTVQGYAQAGMAGILIEDQASTWGLVRLFPL